MDAGSRDDDVFGGSGFGSGDGFGPGSGDEDSGLPQPRTLPPDLPKSLDDRRQLADDLVPETELYDGWQGQSQFLTSPILAKPLGFGNLTLNDPNYEEDLTKSLVPDSDTRLMEMLAAQAALSNSGVPTEDEDAVAASETLSDDEKRAALQRVFNMAASNGNVAQVQKLLTGAARPYVDINATDEDGTPPLIYASCFGHDGVVQALLEAGADVDRQDRNHWSALMWAMTNRHKAIAKLLLDNGASTEAKTSSGRTAFDFVPPDSEMSFYLHDSGYNIGSAGVTDDFYNPGFSQDRFEEEMAENEMRRRMMMESARDLEVDLGNVGIDDQPEPVEEFEEEQQEFDWTRCLHDQMFVFQEADLNRILDIVITHMTPQRSPSQKPVPANVIFLSARYAHYHASSDLLAKLLVTAMDKINDVVEEHQWDMTILAFWMSNATLLLHYLKKDTGLVSATTDFQVQLTELVNEIFILIVRDAERRIDKVLDAAMLDHETIPGFEDITFQNEWKIFKRKREVKEEPLEKRLLPPSPKQRAKPAPRNVTSLLSSTLFVLDLYDVHSVITAQIIAQLLYWLGCELFNRIMANRKYLARTKAMQIRMNVSILEDWARANNRVPEHYEHGEMRSSGEPTVEAARRHLEPVIQLLQWLQCFSSLGADDLEALVGTLQQLKALTPQQLIHAADHYRPEVGEKGLPKSAKKYLAAIHRETALRREELRNRRKTLSPTPKKKTKAVAPAAAGAPTAGSSSSSGGNSISSFKDKIAKKAATAAVASAVPGLSAEAAAVVGGAMVTTAGKVAEIEAAAAAEAAGQSKDTPTTPTTPVKKASNGHGGDRLAMTPATPGGDGDGIDMDDDDDDAPEHLLLDPALMLPFVLPSATDMLVTYGAGFGGVNREREHKYIPTLPPEFLAKLEASNSNDGRARPMFVEKDWENEEV